MSSINIERKHNLSYQDAQALAEKWQRDGEQKYGLSCRHESQDACDVIHFERSGVSGQLKVTPDAFKLDAKLGFLLGTFKKKIEDQIHQSLDDILA